MTARRRPFGSNLVLSYFPYRNAARSGTQPADYYADRAAFIARLAADVAQKSGLLNGPQLD